MSSKKVKTITNEGNRANIGSGNKIPIRPSLQKYSGFTVTVVNIFEANVPLYFIPRDSAQHQKALQ